MRHPIHVSVQYGCSCCPHTCNRKDNADRHVGTGRCSSAGAVVVVKKMYFFNYTESREEAEALMASGQVPVGLLTLDKPAPDPDAPSGSGSAPAPAPAPAYAPPMHTRESLLHDDVTVFGSDEESNAMLEYLETRLDVFGADREGAVARVFEACKVGAGIPLALGNMAVSGNDVYYKAGERAVKSMTKAEMVKVLYATMLHAMESVLYHVYHGDPPGIDGDMHDALKQMYESLYYGYNNGSVRNMALMYRDDRAAFKRSGYKDLKKFVEQEARGLTECLNRLPRYSHRG